MRQPQRRLFGQRVGIQPEQLLQILGCLTDRTLLLLPLLLLLLMLLLLLLVLLLVLLRWRWLHQLLRLTLPP